MTDNFERKKIYTYDKNLMTETSVNKSRDIEKLLITKEAYWSSQLFSLAPFGLNKRQEFHSKKRINYN